MSLPKFAIENHQFSTIVVTLLVLLGIMSYFTMPRSEDPQISPAGTSIFAVYPGANPIDVEKLVIKPIEDELNELEDIKEITSTARTGFGIVEIEFLSGSDGDEKYSDVIQKVNNIRNNLPDEILTVDMIKWTITDVKILQIALVSETSPYRELEKEAEVLQDELKNIPGVGKVEIWGFPEQEVRITPNFEKMAQLNISLSHLIGALQISNLNIPGGKLDIGGKDFGINTSGNFETLEEIENTIINFGSNEPIYLKDIATVDYSYEDQNYYTRFNGKRSVFVTVSQKGGTNIFTIIKQLKSRMQKYENNLTPRIQVETVFDQSIDVSNRLDGFFFNLLQGLFLVGIIVILAVGFRASVIVMTVIPISLIIGIGLLDFSNYGLQQMSIAGLVVALGLLVDNAIVVTENIARFMNLGYIRWKPQLKGHRK